ncbi:AAA family ATPase [Streptomyces sp. NPDC091368]|uniref:AAA family ATPase n=1 Tax=Streptomyces sp. NPDC091368 TaxID=3365993 RepID=UPI0038214CFD
MPGAHPSVGAGAPRPPHAPPGWGTPGGVPQRPAASQHPTPPHPAGPPHPGAPQPPFSGPAPHPGAAPQPPSGQHPAAPQQPPSGQHPAAPQQPSSGQHPAAPQQPSSGQHPAAPQPSSGQYPVAPRHPSAVPPRGDMTGQVPLPPVAAPLAQPVEHGTGTGGATLAVLLIGPAGAGKTTVARHWAQRRLVPTAHISLDDVREWVCSGFADPQSGWNEHSEAQYRLARRTCGFAARNFLANGISCIVDDAVFPDRPVVGLGGWKRHVGPGLLPVVLLPGLEVVLERNAERSGNRRLSDEEVAAIHGRMAGWYGSGLPIIDNSTYDVETTARVLDDVLARAIASPPTW